MTIKNTNSDDWDSDYAKYPIAEMINNFDSKNIEELTKPILTKEECKRRQIEKLQKETCNTADDIFMQK